MRVASSKAGIPWPVQSIRIEQSLAVELTGKNKITKYLFVFREIELSQKILTVQESWHRRKRSRPRAPWRLKSGAGLERGCGEFLSRDP